MKLSKTQQELLTQMQAGAVLHYMPYSGTFNPEAYFFCQVGRKCTAAAQALIDKGLVRLPGELWGKHCELTDAGKSWKPDDAKEKT